MAGMNFIDRTDAGRQLLGLLKDYRHRSAIVLALPRGGLPVAAEIARGLAAELDILIVRKIGLPWQPELAMGALVDASEPIVVRNEEVIAAAGVSAADFDRVLDRERIELARRRARYLRGRPHSTLKDRVVIVADDGLATGMTMLAAVEAVRKQSPAELVVAVPVAATDSLARVGLLADRIACVFSTPGLGSIGQYYLRFDQLSDEDVLDTLTAFDAKRKVDR